MLAPDLILHGGHIHTMDTALPQASALAILNDRVIAVGSDDDILPLAGAHTRRQQLNGRTVLPGFVDAHIHWMGMAEALHTVQLYDAVSAGDAVQRVAEHAHTVSVGQWIIGYGWSQDAWLTRAFPTAADLDAVSPDHPVMLRARSGHAIWANTVAMRLCGIDAHTSDPPGGEVLRDPAGQPTGIFLEWSAMALIADRVPPRTPDQIADQMARLQTVALAMGMTGFHDFDDQVCLSALIILRERGDLRLRAVKQINKAFLDSALHMGLRYGFGDDWLRLGNLKIFADGAIGPHTAAMLAAYDGEPENYGLVVTPAAEMRDLVLRATATGFPSTIHAIGDRAVRDVLDVYTAAREHEAGLGIARSARRHRIEHVQLIHPDDAARLADLDLIASMQPIHATSDYEIADRFWGSRVPFAYNPRLQLDRGVVVAFGSDAPYDIMGPLAGIHAAVTRRRANGDPSPDGWTPDARIDVIEAIRAYTVAPAYAASVEDRQGKIANGYLADLVVLDRDPLAVPPADLHALHVEATMVAGQWMHGGLN